MKVLEVNILFGVDIKKFIDVGVVLFYNFVLDDELLLMLEVYNVVLWLVFIVGIFMGVMVVIILCFFEFKLVKVNKEGDVVKNCVEDVV